MFPQKVISLSVKSNSYRHSKIICFNLYKKTQFIFDEVRQGIMQDITLEDVKVILRDKVRQTIRHINLYEWETNKWNEKELQDRIDEIDDKENKLKERLQSDFKGTTEHLAKEVDTILKDKDLKPDKKNYEYRGLISRWTDLQVIRESWKKDLLKGVRKKDDEYLEELEDKWKLKLFRESNDKEIPEPIEVFSSPCSLTDFPPIPIEPPRNKVDSPFFCDMFPKHLERMRENKRRERTIVETEETYKDVIELLGNKPIGNYTKMDGREFRNSLRKIPKNRKRVKRYRDKTLKEVMELDIPPSDKMSFDNQTKLISRMTSCWNFFVDEFPEYVSENVFKSVSIRVNPVKRKDRRGEFTQDDIHLIFNHRTYLPAIFDNPTGRKNTIQYPHYFVPILAVFTGCRLEELCMMKTENVKQVDGIWVYQIREEGEYGKEETIVKNPYSERDIPLHPVLVDTLGFVRYVDYVKKQGKDRVFWELTKVNGRYSHNFGRFFNEKYLKKIGLKDGGRNVRRLSFHSFRHSVETHLTNKNVNPRYIDFLQGHSQKGMGGNVYMKGISVEVLLKECVEKIDWGVAWETLKINVKN
jgi:integrase|tara:strand:+ start:1579 stop:3330 length:1752 start_codon:yes stop_codon:yes gene_type:complete